MSDNVNSDLYEHANELAEYWTGTMWGRLIDFALDKNDLEALAELVTQAEAERSMQEDFPVSLEGEDAILIEFERRGLSDE